MKGFRKSTRFLSEYQELLLIKQLLRNGPMHCQDITSNEPRLGKWFTPSELRAAINKAITQRIRAHDTWAPYALAPGNQVVPCTVQNFEDYISDNVRKIVKKMTPFRQAEAASYDWYKHEEEE